MGFTISYGARAAVKMTRRERALDAFELVERLQAEQRPNIKIIGPDHAPLMVLDLEALCKAERDYLDADRT